MRGPCVSTIKAEIENGSSVWNQLFHVLVSVSKHHPKNRNFKALFPIKKSTIILLIRLFETMNQETLFGSLFRTPNQEPFVVSLPISVSRGIQFDRSGERSSTFAPGTRLVLRCEDGAKPFPKSRAKCRCQEEKCAWSKLHKTQCLTL